MKENIPNENEQEKIEPNIKIQKKRLVLKDKNFDEIYQKINFLKLKHKEHEENDNNNKIFSYYNYDLDKIMKDDKLKYLFQMMEPNIQINSFNIKNKNNDYDFKNKFQNFRINQNNNFNPNFNYNNNQNEYNNNFNKTVKLRSYRNNSSLNIHNNNYYNNYGGTLRNSNSTNFFKTSNYYVKPSFRYDYYNKKYYDENYNNRNDNYEYNNYYINNNQLFEYKLSNPWQAKYEYKDYLNEINKLDEALNIVGNYKVPSKFKYRKKFYY